MHVEYIFILLKNEEKGFAVLKLKLLIAMAGKRFTERLSCKCRTTGAKLL